MALLRQQWRRDRGNLLGWSVTLALLTYYLAAAFHVFGDTGIMKQLATALETLPAGMKALFAAGDPIFTIQGWVEGMLYTGTIQLIFLIFTGLYVAGLVTRESDQRSLEFLLSLPVERSRVLLTRWLGLVANLAVLHLIHWVAVVLAVGKDARPLAYLWADINMFLAFTAIGGLLLLVSLFIDDYPRGVAALEGIAIAIFFAEMALEGDAGWQAALRKVLPFHYFNPSKIIAGGRFPTVDALILAGVSLLFLALAVLFFNRKQVAA